MSNDLTVFTFAPDADIRVNDEEQFVAGAVARLLEYGDPDDAVWRHCKHPVKRRVGSPLSRAHDVTLTMIPDRDSLPAHHALQAARRRARTGLLRA